MCKLNTELPFGVNLWKSLKIIKCEKNCLKTHLKFEMRFEITNSPLIYAMIDQKCFHRKSGAKMFVWNQNWFYEKWTQSIVQDETTLEYTKAFNPLLLKCTIESFCIFGIKNCDQNLVIFGLSSWKSNVSHIYIHIRPLGSTQRRSIPRYLISIYMYNNMVLYQLWNINSFQ